MANPKPKKTDKTAKKSTEKSESSREAVATSNNKMTHGQDQSTCKGFFARKCDKGENVLTIFKTPKIWGALLGELIGTMLLAMLLLTMGLNPQYLVLAVVCIYAVIVGLSGAHLNPLVTAGMMATRRMSAIRGVLYMLAQVLGAWIGLIIANAFRLGSGTSSVELMSMVEVTGETFWVTALIELLGAMVLAFCFARALRFVRRSPLAFAFTISSSLLLVLIFGLIIMQNYFGLSGNTFIFNPAVALMYQILPTTADGIGELASLAGLALAAYVLVPIIGGIIGFFVADVTTRLAGSGYDCDDFHCDHCGVHQECMDCHKNHGHEA